MKDHTSESFSKAMGVEKDKGYGFLRFLEAAGLVENLGLAPKTEKTKGKPPILYRVKPEAAEKLTALLNAL